MVLRDAPRKVALFTHDAFYPPLIEPLWRRKCCLLSRLVWSHYLSATLQLSLLRAAWDGERMRAWKWSESHRRHSCSLLNLVLLRRNLYFHLDLYTKHVIKSQHMLIVLPFTALSDSLTVFAFIIQVQRSRSCWTAHPTTCTWPSSLTSACLLLVSIWSTQVWGEMPCLTTCHFYSAVTLFPCVRLASFPSCFSVLDGWGDASLGGSEKKSLKFLLSAAVLGFICSLLQVSAASFFLFGCKCAHNLSGLFAHRPVC